MFPYSVLYWIGLSISLCLICPVSVWLSNSLGNYSVLILLQVYFILMFSFLKFLPLSIYLWSMVWVASQHFTRAIPGIDSYIFFPCFILNTFLVLQIPLVNTSCHSYSFTITLAFVYLSLVSLRLLCNTCHQNISECLTNTLSKVTRLLTSTASKQAEIYLSLYQNLYLVHK